jgi:hypothetical protein
MRAARFALSLLPLSLLPAACGVAAPPVTPPGASAPAAPTAAPATPTAAPAAPTPSAPSAPSPGCHPLIASMVFGAVLEEGDRALEGKTPTELLPAVAAAGFEVAALVGIAVGDDTSARALVLHPPREEGQSPFDARPTSLGIATCSPERGYALAGRPIGLHDSTSVVTWATQELRPPSGARATAVTLAQGGIGLEFHATVFVLGAASPTLPVVDPKAEPVGALGVFGNVAEQYLAGEGGEYARVDRVDGTGFFPLGEELVLLSLRHDHGLTRASTLGGFGPKGLRMGPWAGPSPLAAVGKGELPSFCKAAEASGAPRCARLGLPESIGVLPYDWIAGLWPSAEAAGAALSALGAAAKDFDYLLVDTSDDVTQEKGPAGKRAAPFLRGKSTRR